MSTDIAGGRVPDPGGADGPDGSDGGWADRLAGRTAPVVEDGAAPWRRRWARSTPTIPEHPRIWG